MATSTSFEDAKQQLLDEHQRKDLLKFITCGSVDDGKSTLIGRLLLEAGAIYDDQIAALQNDSRRNGTTDGEIDTALLLDGLEDERQQGITIDVAYRYFTTAKRKFIIADTPGHEQFTRNMATGASTADLAIILVDATKGILTQTRRHAFIVSLLGIKHVILAVNKMDLVDFCQATFVTICQQFQEFAKQLDIPDVRFIPLSALRGDNIVQPSPNTLWYADGSLLQLLESVYVGADTNLHDLRFPVQWVNRPNARFRGFCGQLASGTIRRGDSVVVLPSRKQTRVKEIITMDAAHDEASAGDSVTLTLEDEVDIARGDMLVHPDNQPWVQRKLDAMLVWMSEQPLLPGKSYWIKHTTRRTSGEVTAVSYTIDVNTLHQSQASTLRLNEIGRVQIATHDPLMIDSYKANRQTGSFIVVDRITHETVAAGMALVPHQEQGTADHWDDQPEGRHLHPVVSLVSNDERERRYNQRPLTILITGLSGAGKTTIAQSLEQQLFAMGHAIVLLDGQNLRLGISRELGFSAEERSENLRRAAEIAKLLNDAGIICIGAFAAPHADVRAKVRQLVGNERLFHVHLATPVEVCRERDTSGRYAAADRGEIVDFPGVTSTYEEPDDADLVVSTETQSCAEVVEQITARIASRLK